MVVFINSEEEGACTFAVYILLHPVFAFSSCLPPSLSLLPSPFQPTPRVSYIPRHHVRWGNGCW